MQEMLDFKEFMKLMKNYATAFGERLRHVPH
jgi:hypothetical protein